MEQQQKLQLTLGVCIKFLVIGLSNEKNIRGKNPFFLAKLNHQKSVITKIKFHKQANFCKWEFSRLSYQVLTTYLDFSKLPTNK